ncbi:hypothetical protein Y032_0238g3301 [Ancylostoma ceylanicum]|uniref:Uncharacterized protein n=1 Tax=Ancylostoma ceylanicum TaxID=53326 RepID=A0A016SEL3_9BILA|nr:hypothetical protein Y032_0238g3301 [Ancylostoma ceylanicum]
MGSKNAHNSSRRAVWPILKMHSKSAPKGTWKACRLNATKVTDLFLRGAAIMLVRSPKPSQKSWKYHDTNEYNV